jgi:hypothetical protein
MRLLVICLVLLTQLTLPGVAQPEDPAPESATSTCTLDDGKQVSVRYTQAPEKKGEEMRDGKLWQPSGSPLLLFTQTAITLGHTDIPAGAYAMYVVPGRKHWTLVVNSNVTAGSAYDEKQDLVREPMDIGELGHLLTQPEVGLGRTGPKECGLRVYNGKQGAWASFTEK